MDPITAFALAKAAVAGIKSCVDMLNSGAVEIQRVKKDVEQGVESAKAIYKEVTGLWGWLTKLFRPHSPAAPTLAVPRAEPQQATQPGPKAKKSKRDEYVEHIPDEDEIVDQFARHVIQFFKIQAWWIDHLESERRRIFTATELTETNQEAAFNLVLIETRMGELGAELRQLMTSGAPAKLGAVYSRFNEMYGVVTAEQKKASAAKRKREAEERNRQYQERNHRIDMRNTFFVTVFAIVYVYWFVWVTWEAKNPIWLR